MAGAGLSRRVRALETTATASAADLSHLSDEDLEAMLADVIERMANEAGVILEDDWRQRLVESPIRYSEKIERRVKEMLEWVD